MPTYLSDDEVRLILRAKEANDVSLCYEPINRWINHRVRVMVSNEQFREDIVGECFLFFIKNVFPRLEIRELPPTSAYLAKRINMYIRHQYNRYKRKFLDYDEYERTKDRTIDSDTTIESTGELTSGGPVFTKVVKMLMDGKRQFEVAKELGISRQRVWQIKQKMKRKWNRNA